MRVRSRILFPSGAKMFVLVRSRIIYMRIRSRIILVMEPKPNYDEVLEPNYYEDPEPNYYFCINNNNFVIIFIFRIRSRIFRIRSRIFRIRRCIIILLIIISLFFLRIRSRIIILLIIRIILLILKGPEWKKHKDYELIIIY